MKPLELSLCGILLLASSMAWAQQAPKGSKPATAPESSDSMTVRGCLLSERGNFIVVTDTGMVYALRGVGDKLQGQLNHEVEVKGQLGDEQKKTGTRSGNVGSAPSDTVRGVNGIVLDVADAQKDVRTTSPTCKRGKRK